MSPTLTLLLDVLLLLLLAGTIFVAVKLNARLKILKDVRKDFDQMIVRFDEASRRAELGVQSLQNAARDSGQNLQKRLDRAETLQDDLSIIIETAENIATRLERGASQASSAMGGVGGGSSSRVSPRERGPGSNYSPSEKSSTGGYDTPRRSSPMSRPAESPAPAATPDPRSRAERELLQALLKGEGGETSR